MFATSNNPWRIAAVAVRIGIVMLVIFGVLKAKARDDVPSREAERPCAGVSGVLSLGGETVAHHGGPSYILPGSL